ncbi:MAG: hypothetical protein EXR62_11325 [Chloroflexi bacterium]|nr:hypothetical protein [Chloroflexota bacterium]
MSNQNQPQMLEDEPRKKQYHQPQLTRYGDLRETRTGQGNSTDNNQQNSSYTSVIAVSAV